MGLEKMNSVTTLVSAVVAVAISVASFFAGAKLQQLEITEKEYANTARFSVELRVLPAKDFAVQRLADMNDGSGKQKFDIVPELHKELNKEQLESWKSGNGLMVGEACNRDIGLYVRQIVVLVIKNTSAVDATDVKLDTKWKFKPATSHKAAWHEFGEKGRPREYFDLEEATEGWAERKIEIGDMNRFDPSMDEGQPKYIVLASVAGPTWMYGTVHVPVKISWINAMNKQPGSKMVTVRTLSFQSALEGGDIGSLVGSKKACPKSEAATQL